MTDKEILSTLGANLRRLRERRGLSALQVAYMLDMSPDAVRKYERGERDPGIANIIRAQNSIHCSIMTIFSGLIDESDGGREYNTLSARCSRIMRWLATDWDGDIEALVLLMGLIASFPEEQRRELYMEACLTKDRLLASGKLSAADLPDGIEYMESKIGSLYENRKEETQDDL